MKSTETVRISTELKTALDDLVIELWGVTLQTYDLKIQHLLWHYTHYKNNNGHKK